MLLRLYSETLRAGESVIQNALLRRQKKGKESAEPVRFDERRGIITRPRPEGSLVWVHAASVGEAQSALILIRTLLDRHENVHVMVTTGTLTSAAIMEKSLPDRAFHQFYPVDHPDWVSAFLDHWSPDLILWMESELWPNMLLDIQKRAIPAILVNARLSSKSYRHWRVFKRTAQRVLNSFATILCQTEEDAAFYTKLGAQNVQVTDNIKYSANALPADDSDLKYLRAAIGNRPTWVYASTHKGEEEMAARIHDQLKATIPDLLTIIVPRHPDRRAQIDATLEQHAVSVLFRGNDKTLPNEDTDLYIADTLGELGLFYRACPVACIGRSFSDDGGGGHNPIEAAQLHCAVLHGPNVQNLQVIFDEMNASDAAYRAENEAALGDMLGRLLTNDEALRIKQQSAFDFARKKHGVLDRVMGALAPYLESLSVHKDAP